MTRDQYLADHYRHHLQGNDLPHSRLTPELVREIRANRHGETLKQMAERMGVHRRTVEKVHYFETWRHV